MIASKKSSNSRALVKDQRSHQLVLNLRCKHIKLVDLGVANGEPKSGRYKLVATDSV